MIKGSIVAYLGKGCRAQVGRSEGIEGGPVRGRIRFQVSRGNKKTYIEQTPFKGLWRGLAELLPNPRPPMAAGEVDPWGGVVFVPSGGTLHLTPPERPCIHGSMKSILTVLAGPIYLQPHTYKLSILATQHKN